MLIISCLFVIQLSNVCQKKLKTATMQQAFQLQNDARQKNKKKPQDLTGTPIPSSTSGWMWMTSSKNARLIVTNDTAMVLMLKWFTLYSPYFFWQSILLYQTHPPFRDISGSRRWFSCFLGCRRTLCHGRKKISHNSTKLLAFHSSEISFLRPTGVGRIEKMIACAYYTGFHSAHVSSWLADV